MSEYDLNDSDDPRFGQTEFVVEANGYESLSLWSDCQKEGISWEQENGLMIRVGEVENMPVNISVMWNVVGGMRILFWDSISRMVDYTMIEEWFDRNCCPMYDKGTRKARTNAMNFPFVEINRKEERRIK